MTAEDGNGDKGSQGCPDCPETPTWNDNIKDLFSTDVDIPHMKPVGIDLSSYDEVKESAQTIYDTLQPDSPWPGGHRMPKGGPYWTEDCIACFKKWMDTDFSE